MSFSVIVTQKGGPTRRLEFEKDEITIGRMDENDICLPAGNVSKKHTRIFFKEGKFIVVDLKSTNGTFVNGKKIVAPQVLKEQDQVAIGDYILNVENGDLSSYEGGSYEATTVAPPEPPAAPATPPAAPAPAAAPPTSRDLTGPYVPRASTSPGAPAGWGPMRPAMIAAVRELYAGACEALAAGVTADLWTAARAAVRGHLATMQSSGMLQPGLDEEELVNAATAEVAGLGPLEVYLADAGVTEVTVSGPEVITVTRGGRTELSERFFSSDEALLSALARLFAPGGTDRLAGFTLFADFASGIKPRVHLVLRRR